MREPGPRSELLASTREVPRSVSWTECEASGCTGHARHEIMDDSRPVEERRKVCVDCYVGWHKVRGVTIRTQTIKVPVRGNLGRPRGRPGKYA